LKSKKEKYKKHKILVYSAKKIKANPTAPYSTLNPDTSSDSSSAKSKRVLLVSARQPPRTGGSSYFLIENSRKTNFFDKNLFLNVNLAHFVRNRSRKIVFFTSGQFQLFLFTV
jgi:hypothetical protein